MNMRPPPLSLGRVTLTKAPLVTAVALKAPAVAYSVVAKPPIVLTSQVATAPKALPASLILAPTPSKSISATVSSQAIQALKPAYALSDTATAVVNKPSAVIAPAFISAQGTAAVKPAIAPEIAKPGITQPAAAPYAPDATWEDFAEPAKPAAAAEEDPFADVPDAFVQPRSEDDTAPVIKAAKVVEQSWWDKLLGVFGLSRRSAVSATMAGEAASMATMTQSEAAAQLVRRARNGDQNAMAMITCVREAAARGSAKAKLSAKLMFQYMKAHPVGDDPSEFGIEDVIPRTTPEPSDPATAAAVALSHGPKLSNPRIEEFVRHARFHADEINAFEHGLAGRAMRNPDPRIQKANKFGGLMAHARKLQAVRMEGSPVSKFDANIGWELGEDIDIR